MLSVVNFLRGYLEVEITGPFPERFLNICSQNGISFWQLDRSDRDRMFARVRVMEYGRLRELAGKALCDVRVVSKRGAPFFVWRFRKRYLFIAGFFLFAAILWLSSMRVWEINVVGNETVSDERILRALGRLGVGIGTLASEIDPEKIENGMLLEIGELKWLTVNVRGSRATVEVRERTVPPEVVDEKTPCNIVARKAGIITRIFVLEGTAHAAVGDTVTEGQLLASGVIDTAAGARLVHAAALAEAQTWYTLTACMPMEVGLKEYTGKTAAKRALIVAGKRINLYFGSSISYDRCDNMVKKRQWSLPGGPVLPVVWITGESAEYSVVPGQADAKTAVEILRANLLSRLQEQIGEGEIIRTDFSMGTKSGNYSMTLTAECREEIAVAAKIPVR